MSFVSTILTRLTDVFPSKTLYAMRRKWADDKIIDSEMAPYLNVQRLHYRQGYHHGMLIAEAQQKHGIDVTYQCYKAFGSHPDADMSYIPHYPTGVRDGMRAYRLSM